MTPARLFVFLAFLAVAAGAVWWWQSETPPAPTPVPEAGPPVDPAKPPESPLLTAPAPVRNPTKPQEMIRYPDGTYMPALNGVRYPAALQWPPDLPYSPIVGRQTMAGTEWYVHADGTLTTTQMKWRSDIGREDALTQVARPMPVAPSEEAPSGAAPPPPPTGEKK